MVLEGKIDVQATAEKTWSFLLDIDQFTSCLPGVEKISQIDERTFEGSLAAAVGPISGHFAFRAKIIDSRPPEEMVVEMRGSDSVTNSNVHSNLKLTLTAREENRTEIGYHAGIDIKGRLAILGDMVLRATANLLLEEFVRKLKERLEESARGNDPS